MQYYEASGIAYHCKDCGCTVTKEFLLGEIVLPLKDSAVVEQNLLKKKYERNDLLMHVENCICEDCVPKLNNHERILSNSEIFYKKNIIVTKCKHELEVANEKITHYYTTELHAFLNNYDILAYCSANNFEVAPGIFKDLTEIDRFNMINLFVRKHFKELKSIAFKSVNQKYPNEILSSSTEIAKKYYHEFKDLNDSNWTANEVYLKSSKPINLLDIDEYLKVNDNFNEHILDCKEDKNNKKIYEVCVIDPATLGFPLPALDAFNIFDVILNNIRFKDKLVEKIIAELK